MIRHLRQLCVAATGSPGDLIGRHADRLKPREQARSIPRYMVELPQLDAVVDQVETG